MTAQAIYPNNADTSTRAQVDLGYAIARMFTAAQGVSLHTADKALEAAVDAPYWTRWAFSTSMQAAGHPVALPQDATKLR